jgi:hypothetical protein
MFKFQQIFQIINVKNQIFLYIEKNQDLLHPQHKALIQNNILILRFMTILILLIV